MSVATSGAVSLIFTEEDLSEALSNHGLQNKQTFSLSDIERMGFLPKTMALRACKAGKMLATLGTKQEGWIIKRSNLLASLNSAKFGTPLPALDGGPQAPKGKAKRKA